MESYRKKLILKRLGSFNVIIIVVFNVLLPFVTYLCTSVVIEFQISKNYIEDLTTGYYNRIWVLCLVLNILVLGILDYIFLIYPIVALEHTMEEYQKLVQIENETIYDKYFMNSSLEKMFLDMLEEQRNIRKRELKKETQRQETELFALQTQINPHFLYNTLDSIRGMALLNDATEIATMTEALSKLFRNMISKEGKMLTLREELENVKNYMLIQGYRFNDKFQYHCNVDEEILDCYKVPNLTLQPIVENAIMHGLEKKCGKGKIIITGYLTEKRMIINVVDNGVGIKEERLEYLNKQLANNENSSFAERQEDPIGIALLNINKRLKLRFGKIYGITIESTPDIKTTTEVVLPLIASEELEQKGNLYE